MNYFLHLRILDLVHAHRLRTKYLFISLIFVMLWVSPALVFAKIMVNEVMWAGSDLSTSDEWIELARTPDDCGQALTLSGMTVTVVNSSGIETTVIRFGAGDTLQCDQYPVISHFTEDKSRLALLPTFVVPSLSLPNTKLLLRLRDAGGTVIDVIDDGVGEPMAGSNATSPALKASMERVNFALDGGLKQSWANAVASKGFDSDAPVLGTPGFENGDAQSSSEASSQASSVSSSSAASSSRSSQQSSSSSSVSSSEQSEASSSQIDQSSYSSNESEAQLESKSSISISETSSSISSSPVPLVPPVSLESRVKITELLPNPVGADTDEWIELGNLGSYVADITGVILTVSGSSVSYHLSGQALQPGEYRSFRRSQTGIVLDNRGKTVLLKSVGTLIDSFSYSEVPEGISVGRLLNGMTLDSFCVPTEGQPNIARDPEVTIHIQSGETTGEEQVSLNLEGVLEPSIKSSSECHWDFQDGFTSENCNPPSHTFTEPGTYVVALRVIDYCSNTVERSLQINVFEKIKSSSARSSFSSSYSSSRPASVEVRTLAIPSQGGASLVAQGEELEVTLVGAFPNPSGKDQGNEWVEVQNSGRTEATLTGWILQSTVSSGRCSLDGIHLGLGARERVPLSACSFSLVNTKGGVRLVDAGGVVRSTIEWSEAKEGKVYAPGTSSSFTGESGRVLRVIDGDTFVLEPNVTVRMLGVDAPEVSHPQHTEDPYGKESQNFLRALLEGKKIELQFDTKKEDTYGRTLAYVSLEGVDIQAKLLKEGYARVYIGSVFSKQAEYRTYEMEARAAGKGMWDMVRQAHHDILSGSLNISGNNNNVIPSLSRDIASKHVVLPIFINEIYPAPNAGEKEWIELYNPHDSAVSIVGWMLDDVQNGGSKAWKIPDDTWIMAGEYLVITSQQSGLKLNDDIDDAWLTSYDGSFTDHLTYKKAKKGMAFSRLSTESTALCMTTQATRGAENACIDQKLYSKKSTAKKAVTPTAARVSSQLETLRSQLVAFDTAIAQTGEAQELPIGVEKPVIMLSVLTAVLVSISGAFIFVRKVL